MPATSSQYSLKRLFHPITDQLEVLEDRLPGYLNCRSPVAQKILAHTFDSRGKRIRPALFLLAAKIFRINSPFLYQMAAVCEYVHTASLLHDDVLDEADVRRNRPTPHTLWGKSNTILVGDLMYSRASHLMADTGKLDIVKAFAHAIERMSEAEICQLENTNCFSLDRSTYLEIIQGKTAQLISASLAAAGILAEASLEKIKALEGFGMAIGLAFQLLDDALDYQSDTKTLGKKNFTDLEEGKVTYPLIFARDQANQADKLLLEELFVAKTNSDERNQQVKDLLVKYNGIEETITYAEQLTTEGIELIQSVFPESDEREQLLSLAYALIFRNY